jgi:putative protein-disulfide isomerase
MHLIYIGDPMCSWCYGFGTQLSKLLRALPQIHLEIVVGGLRAGATDVLDDAGKQFRLSHWARVEEASGVAFNREAFKARQRFIYNTEPICRAVVAARTIAPDAPQLDIFRALQHAFYVRGLDTTDSGVLVQVTMEAILASGHAVDESSMRAVFLSESTVEKTRADFARAKRLGVSSFPSLLLSTNGSTQVVVPGYASADTMLAAITRLAKPVG